MDGNLQLTSINQTHSYNTRLRSNNNFYTSAYKTNVGKLAFSFIGPRFWREVPNDLKTVNHNLFKNIYKKVLLDAYSD